MLKNADIVANNNVENTDISTKVGYSQTYQSIRTEDPAE